MKNRVMLRLRPIYLGYWTVAAVLAGMLLAPVQEHDPAPSQPGKRHIHATHEVDPFTPPAVRIAVSRDALSGWNLSVTTRHFTFAPEMVNKANVPDSGHAHLYVNGHKIARLYAPVFHIANLPEGRNVVSVTLNANDHSDLTLNGQPIAAKVIVMNPAAPGAAGLSETPRVPTTSHLVSKG